MSIEAESAASADCIALVDALDAYLLDLYPPEHNHLPGIDGKQDALKSDRNLPVHIHLGRNA